MQPHPTVAVEPFADDSLGRPAVRGFLHRPSGLPGHALVLAHGAGGNCNAPLLVALASAFANRGLIVLRCDLPFRQARPKGPPSSAGAPLDREGLRQAIRAIRPLAAGKALLGGHSYGGRQASILLAAEPQLADALLLLAYPLHPPGRQAALRTAHFRELRTPTLFVHGSADPFGSLDELEAARALIPAPTSLLALDRARHDLCVGRPAPGASREIAERVAREFLLVIDRPPDPLDSAPEA